MTGDWRRSIGVSARASTPRALCGSGLRLIEVDHVDNRQRAREEALAIRTAIDELLAGGRWTDRHGETHDLTLDDILIVAPYNAQVRCIRQELPAAARVGTVDKSRASKPRSSSSR